VCHHQLRKVVTIIQGHSRLKPHLQLEAARCNQTKMCCKSLWFYLLWEMRIYITPLHSTTVRRYSTVDRYRGVSRGGIEERLTAHMAIPATVIAAVIAGIFQFTNALCKHRVNDFLKVCNRRRKPRPSSCHFISVG